VTGGSDNRRPSPFPLGGEGDPQPAFSSAGAGRVRGSAGSHAGILCPTETEGETQDPGPTSEEEFMGLQPTQNDENRHDCHPRVSGGPHRPKDVDSRFRGNDQPGLILEGVTGGRGGKATRPRTLPFLLEVGCEEIPARFLRDAERGLGERVQATLSEARLLPEAVVGADREPRNSKSEIRNSKSEDRDVEVAVEVEPTLRTCSTPRRLVVYLPAVLARQPDKVEEILGPPVRVAVDAAGKYTRAAESFAQKNSARLEDLARTLTPKGEYLALRKTKQGRTAQEILPEILPGAILGMSFPKSMYWTGKSEPRFVRPIRWVLAVLGEGKRAKTVNFEILGVKSGNFSFGHRVYSKGRIIAKGFSDYAAKLGRAYVQHEREMRRKAVRNKVNALLEDSLKLIDDPELEEWVVNSTEWPSAVRGTFDERFLHLPREILITVMRDHQKYFAVENGQGKLEPYFVAILNLDSDERGLIRQGHERVLQARFRDAEFFWEMDQRVPLRDRLTLLEKVTYQAELGSYADKVKRMLRIGDSIRSVLEKHNPDVAGYAVAIREAIRLCKCDLTTQMVQEFPELQGIVGGLYAAAQGESKEIADAIYDHYLPQGAEDRCPRSLIGAVVSLADKLDGVAAGFAAGHEPTGSSDPFAIRRHANGIIKVLLECSIPIDLNSEIERALDALNEKLAFDLPQVVDAVKRFMRERLTFHLENVAGLRYDTVRAAMGARTHWLNLPPLQILARARAVEKIRSGDDFLSLSQSAKRIRNILNKSAKPSDYQGGNLDPQRLEAGPERDLYEAYERVRDQAAQKRAEGDIYSALQCIAALRSPVDVFFDKVLVMAEDPNVRRNRLQLLFALDRLFTEDADLSQIEKPNVDASTSARNEAEG
jgi:glycyl-tRNA synthetase beta chain